MIAGIFAERNNASETTCSFCIHTETINSTGVTTTLEPSMVRYDNAVVRRRQQNQSQTWKEGNGFIGRHAEFC
ncbi:MAG: hypothetical protein IKE32_00725, partial [Aeriscardovia sp.]|nr:hypothetical protein [Aeriscardovia sp.]